MWPGRQAHTLAIVTSRPHRLANLTATARTDDICSYLAVLVMSAGPSEGSVVRSRPRPLLCEPSSAICDMACFIFVSVEPIPLGCHRKPSQMDLVTCRGSQRIFRGPADGVFPRACAWPVGMRSCVGGWGLFHGSHLYLVPRPYALPRP